MRADVRHTVQIQVFNLVYTPSIRLGPTYVRTYVPEQNTFNDMSTRDSPAEVQPCWTDARGLQQWTRETRRGRRGCSAPAPVVRPARPWPYTDTRRSVRPAPPHTDTGSPATVAGKQRNINHRESEREDLGGHAYLRPNQVGRPPTTQNTCMLRIS